MVGIKRISEIRFPAKLSIPVKSETFVALSCIFYFCGPMIRFGSRGTIGRILNYDVADFLSLAVIYIPLLIGCIMSPKKHIKLDFLVLLSGVCLFFGVSLLTHPEYAYWYARDDYGVWNYVLMPAEAVYSYLFVRLIDDPNKLRSYIKAAGWVMFIYYGYQVLQFLRRGYWTGIVGQNNQAEADHSVTFAYGIMLFAIFFLYDALTFRRPLDIVGSIISIGMMIFGGTRGPFAFFVLFLALYLIVNCKTKNGKLKIAALFSVGGALAYFCYAYLINGLSYLVQKFGIHNRIFDSLVDGSFADDHGRNEIWQAAIQMIQENPWGYGGMGSQPVISKYIYVGYPHSVFLEMWIDFGVIFGSVILLFLLWNTAALLFHDSNRAWRGTFLAFFATACQLLVSMCFWSSTAFWSCIAVGVNMYLQKKRKKQDIISVFSPYLMRNKGL